MDLLPHQLEPALAIVHGRGTRMLIADEVGLGKTVQAALIVAELKARGAAARVLVLTPAGLREQWVEEFASRFGLRVTLFDMATAARHRASLPVGVNPWSVEPFIVTSIDYIKRPEVLPRRSSLPMGRRDRRRGASCRHRNGSPRRGRRALQQRAVRGAAHRDTAQRRSAGIRVAVRNSVSTTTRSRCFAGLVSKSATLACAEFINCASDPAPEERQMHAALDAFVRAVQREPDGRDQSTWLALSTLRKRALSSAFALQRSVERRLQRADFGERRRLSPAHVAALRSWRANSMPQTMCRRGQFRRFATRDHERELLSRVAHAAAHAVGRESKTARRSPACFDESRNRPSSSPSIATRWCTSAIASRPAQRFSTAGCRATSVAPPSARSGQGGVLLATDAAGEGLNLHHNCRIVVNLELPWNPMRLEQRIGRVDRIGQTRTGPRLSS